MNDVSGNFGSDESEPHAQLEVVGIPDVQGTFETGDDLSGSDVAELELEADRLEELHEDLRAQLVGQDPPHQR